MINDTDQHGFNGGSNLLFAFLTGASIGAAAGLLLAPRTGKESREQLRGYFQKTRERMENVAREGAGMAREAVSRFREAGVEAAEEIASSSMRGSDERRHSSSGMRKS